MGKRAFSIKWLIFLLLLCIGGVGCAGFGVAWYKNELDLRISELTKRAELSLKPVVMVAETSISARNYYVLSNEDFIRLFHLESALLFFQIQGKSDLGEPFEFSYCPPKKIGSYTKYPKLYKVTEKDSPARAAKKEEKNKIILEAVAQYISNVADFNTQPAELETNEIYYDKEGKYLYVRKLTANKNGGKVWAVFNADSIAEVENTVLKKVLAISLVAIAILFVLAMFLPQVIAKPLGVLVDELARQSQSLDLSKPISVATFLKEIKKVGASINLLTSKLNDFIGKTQQAAHAVQGSAKKQQTAINNTSVTTEEISEIITVNASNAQNANGLISLLFKEIQQANDTISRLTRSMEELEESSAKTFNIIKSIDEIAFQTNLLALNAAVEAARAGEAGAGFAVVADEVRNLAMRAAEAARDTAGLIEDSVKKTKEGKELVYTANESFSSTTGKIKETAGLMDKIARDSTKQSKGIEKMRVALQDMGVVTHENYSEAENLIAAISAFTTVQPSHDLERQVNAPLNLPLTK